MAIPTTLIPSAFGRTLPQFQQAPMPMLSKSRELLPLSSQNMVDCQLSSRSLLEGLTGCIADTATFATFPRASARNGNAILPSWSPDAERGLCAAAVDNLSEESGVRAIIETFDDGERQSFPFVRLAVLPYSAQGLLRNRFQAGGLCGMYDCLLPPRWS